jgi:hypothetical protein
MNVHSVFKISMCISVIKSNISPYNLRNNMQILHSKFQINLSQNFFPKDFYTFNNPN